MSRNQTDRPHSPGKKSANQDLPDSPRDEERLAPDEASIDLPDVKDIPGQEFIHVPRLGEMADTTISSDDEEGVGLFNEEEEETITTGDGADISREEKISLETGDHLQFREDDQGLAQASLDDADEEGEQLNESFDRTGDDLDVLGADADDRDESAGEEDEENNPYSLGGDKEEG